MNEIDLPKHWIPVNLLGAAHHYTQAAHQYAEAYAIAAVEKDRAERVSVPDGAVVIPRKLAQDCLNDMKYAVRWERDRDGRPPSQICCFEIQDLEALLAAAPQPQPVQDQPKDPLADDLASVLFEVEQAISNGCCPWQIEAAFEAYEAARRLLQPAHGI